jgi:L-2,4-diaminobutyric acid acetyltransferase
VSIEFAVRAPQPHDGRPVHELIASCPPLDPNSIYCNLLQCTHLAQTCAIAEDMAGLAGFVSSYRLPAAPENLFVWQIAVLPRCRGVGLAKRMLFDILGRPACRGVSYVRATFTPDNAASRALFDGLARRLDTSIHTEKLFDAEAHFGGEHDSEHELIVGPFAFSSLQRQEVS